MSYKKWILSILIIVMVLILIYVFAMYKIDFYSYWKAGEEDISFFQDTYGRILKMKHVSENPNTYRRICYRWL